MALTAKQKREARDQKMREEGAEAARKEAGTSTQLSPEKSAALEAANQAQFKNPITSAMAHAAAGGDDVLTRSNGDTVVVACKLGVASYQIQLGRMIEKVEQSLTGQRAIRENEWYGPVVILRGTAYPRGTPPEGFPPPPVIVGGAALNFGIPADWWALWVEQHKNDPLVLNKIIFAHKDVDVVKSAAKEMAGILSGIDPVNPKKDPRITKPTRSEISEVEPDSRNKDPNRRAVTNA